MSDLEAAVVAMAIAGLVIVSLALIGLAVSSAARSRRREEVADVVIDLGFLHDAVRRTESDGRRLADRQRASLSGRRSHDPPST